MELALFIIFAWFLFILGKHFKDFTITFISGALILLSGVLAFPTTGNESAIFAFAIVHIGLGIYILFRSLIELINIYFKDFKFKWRLKKKDGIKIGEGKTRRS
jgi:hypothetical protein